MQCRINYIVICKDDLNTLQQEKLNIAANILKNTAYLYTGNKSLLPLWGAGVITHGIPKINKCVIGITKNAKKAENKDRTKDHLYRVTETAKFVINKIEKEDLTIEDIEKILLQRSALMITTRTENNKILKEALIYCKDKDSWEELYDKAGVEYEIYNM